MKIILHFAHKWYPLDSVNIEIDGDSEKVEKIKDVIRKEATEWDNWEEK